MCEAFWHNNIAEQIIKKFDWDVVIGSVHAVSFAEMGKEAVGKFLEQYFDDMMEDCDFDILAL